MSAISFEATTVSAEKTAGEIEDMLRKAGVAKVGKSFESGRIKAIYFEMDTQEGLQQAFMLPVNVSAVHQILIIERKKGSRYSSYDEVLAKRIQDQAERTAWRIIHWWVKAQLALIQTQMVAIAEVFLPYMLVSSEETLYQRLKAREFKSLNPGSVQ